MESMLFSTMVDGSIDLEAAADALLDEAGALSRADGVYTEAQLTRKIRNEERRLLRVDEYAPSEELVDYLVEHQIEELIDVSGLTTRQEIVYRLYACGLDSRRIAATLKCRYGAAIALLNAAKRKVRQALREGPYAGWYQVYLSEVRRHKTP